jgi:hypothetical protein
MEVRNAVGGTKWCNFLQLTAIILQFVLFTGYDSKAGRTSLEPELPTEKSELEQKAAEEEAARSESEVQEDLEDGDTQVSEQPTENFLTSFGALSSSSTVDEWDNSLTGTIYVHLNRQGKLLDAVRAFSSPPSYPSLILSCFCYLLLILRPSGTGLELDDTVGFSRSLDVR